MSRRRKGPAGGAALLLAGSGLLGLTGACTDGPPTAADPGPPVLLPIAPTVLQGTGDGEADALRLAFDRLDRLRVALARKGEESPVVDTLARVAPGLPSYAVEVAVPLEGEDEAFDLVLRGLEGEVELFAGTGEVRVTRSPGPPVAVELPVRYTGPGVRGRVVTGDGIPATALRVRLLRDGEAVAETETDPDGRFVFPFLPTGAYRVEVDRESLPEGVRFPCPPSREVEVTPAAPSVQVDFRLSAGPCTLRVLVLSGGDVDDNGPILRELRARMPDAELAATFVLGDPPPLDSLLPFHVVLLYENGIFGGARAVGDRLSRYVEAGGNLVLATFYWQDRSDGPFRTAGWGALEDIDPFRSRGGAVYAPGSLDPGSLVPHPLTDGIRTLEADAYRAGVTPKPGTAVVASWSDGDPLIGFRTGAAGQRIVAISLYPGYVDRCCYAGDFLPLWENALRWAGGGSIPAPPGATSRP